MGILKPPYDSWHFTGAKTMNGSFNDGATDNTVGQQVDPPFTTDLSDTAHGLLAGSLLYIENTTNYDGLKEILSLPDANSMLIKSPYVAETLSSATWKTKFSYDELRRHSGDVGASIAAGPKWEFLGFELTLDGEAAVALEYFTIVKKAAKGSAWDNRIYRVDMNGVQFINYIFDDTKPMAPGDKIDCTFANAGTDTWGLTLYTRRLV